MKIIKIMIVALLGLTATVNMPAQSLSDILKGVAGGGNGSAGNILGGIIDGVFTKSNLSLSDLVGEYKAQGPAVTFKSENFLQKAGGIAGAAAIESKLNPYYEQYGLNNMTLSVDENYNFTMKIKSLGLKGTVSKNESDGTFDFNFKVLGINLGKFTAYVEKSGNNLNLMFDATKLKSLISTIAKMTGNSMASALGSILDSYEGACIGWKMVSTSQSNVTNITESQNNNSTTNDSTNNGKSGSVISKGLDSLKGLLNKK